VKDVCQVLSILGSISHFVVAGFTNHFAISWCVWECLLGSHGGGCLLQQFRINSVTLDRPYKLWWQTPIPSLSKDKFQEWFEGEHHMNPRHQCNLTDDNVIDRRAALDILEPDRTKQSKFWWNGNSPHVHAEANHAFNHALLSHFLPREPPSRLRNPLWRMFRSSTKRRLLGVQVPKDTPQEAHEGGEKGEALR
jgi:hypothetical protein